MRQRLLQLGDVAHLEEARRGADAELGSVAYVQRVARVVGAHARRVLALHVLGRLEGPHTCTCTLLITFKTFLPKEKQGKLRRGDSGIDPPISFGISYEPGPAVMFMRVRARISCVRSLRLLEYRGVTVAVSLERRGSDW